MKTFKVRKNSHGFRWASFWLVGKHAHVAAGATEIKRFGGTRALNAGPGDDRSVYSYQTVRSNSVPMKNVSIKKKAVATKHKVKNKKK